MSNISEFQGKSSDELKTLSINLKKELFNLRFQVATGELTNTARFREVRRDVARVKTLLNQPAGSVVAKPAKVKKEKVAKVAKPAAAKKSTSKKKSSGE
jgi:large subunit ribosomal protein L29